MLLAFSMLLGIYSALTASHQLVDHIPLQVNDGAAANPFLSSVSSKSVSERSYYATEFSPQADLDGYFTKKLYRSDRGVVFCGGPLIEADTFKLNACNARTYNSYNSWNSQMVVANTTKVSTKRYTDTKCQNLLRIEASTYTSGACVNGGDKVSLISSINAKLSTDLTAPRVTQV
jgi:hypothetical protein